MDKKMPAKTARGMLTFWGVYQECRADVMQYGGRGWNKDTQAQYDSIVLNRIVPAINDHDSKPISQYTLQDFRNAEMRLKQKGKGGDKRQFVPWEQSTMDKFKFLMKAIVAAGAKNHLCRNCFYEGDDPNDDRKDDIRNFYRLGCTPKSLTIADEVKLARYLKRFSIKDDKLPGLLLMYALGLRNNEACGANFEDVHEFVEYSGHFYLVVSQTTEIGKNTLKINGKTYNSPRKIPISDGVYKLLVKLKGERLKQVATKGYMGDGGALPIACKNGDPTCRCTTSDLSIAAKEVYVKLGMREEDLDDIGRELEVCAQMARDEEEEDEFREIEADPTAYLLRRNCATHLAVLGLSDEEIQYIMGHKIENPYFCRRDFNDELRLFAIKEKMDQRPILNSVFGKEEIIQKQGEAVPFSGPQKLRIRIPVEDCKRVRVTATAREPRDKIKMQVFYHIDGSDVHCEAASYSSPLPSIPSPMLDGRGYYQNVFQNEMVDERNRRKELEVGRNG